MLCFVHFDFKMYFSPQRHAIFQHLNFKKCSEPLSFLACSLQKVLLATAACNFLFLLWPHDSAPAALTSLLFDSPDTRIIRKTQHFATSLTFGAGESSFFWLSRYCIFFLLTLLHLLTLLSCDFTSSICFSSAFQLSILSEVYYLNFLRKREPLCATDCALENALTGDYVLDFVLDYVLGILHWIIGCFCFPLRLLHFLSFHFLITFEKPWKWKEPKWIGNEWEWMGNQ